MNTLQPPLLELRQTVQPEVSRSATIQERFESFHKANPHVYIALQSLVAGMLSEGVREYGIKGLFEILRWQFKLQTKGHEDFRLCNDFTSRYARLLVKENPRFDGFFTMRELRSE